MFSILGGSTMRMSRTRTLVGFACAAASQLAVPATASETVTPTLGGVTIGIPAGAAPPPGLYSSTTFLYLEGNLYNGSGQKTPLRLKEFEASETLFLSTDTKILGGQLFGYLVQPVKTVDTSISGIKNNQTGAFNTIVSPVNLSWSLGSGFFASLGAAFFLPNGNYSVFGDKTSTGYFTAQPTAAISYLNNGYQFTANAHLDLNSKNTKSNYLSGNDIGVDFTALKSFDKLSLGIGGYVVSQFANDKLNGSVVPSGPFNGRGNRWDEAGVGPYASYNFGDFEIATWATFDVYARNTIKSNIGWIRLSVPLGNPLAVEGPSRIVSK